MKLSALLSPLADSGTPIRWLRADDSEDPVIRGISYDSRAVAPGDLFVALRGSASDGHDYLDHARALGATALLVETPPEGAPRSGCPVVVVPDARRALAPVSVRFYGEPAAEMTLVGITGTNGKTSTSYLIESILSRASTRTGLIGTVEVRYAGERQRAVNTTPESLDLQRTLRSMRTHNVEAVVLEVSSHGLELGRVSGCSFAVAAFTNLTQDHLDFHGSMDAYRLSKERLFRYHLAPGGAAVVNIDDPAGEDMGAAASASGARVVRCSRRADAGADVFVRSARVELGGSEVELQLPSSVLAVSLPLVGDFNLENLLVGVGIATALGISAEAIAAGVANCPQVPGRMELIEGDRDAQPTVIVDYAHTPDAVAKLLAAVRPLASGRVITVFGCGGDRDRKKRPLMAQAVAETSDLSIATSDNPRTEDAEAILCDVEEGLKELTRVEPEALGSQQRAYARVTDRREAIRLAVSMARAEDTVVLAGKGHEDYQIIGHDKLPFDDREEARKALVEWRSA